MSFVPELESIKAENAKIKAILVTNKRLDDVNLHLLNLSRRIDDTNKSIDDTNKRIDTARDELVKRIDAINGRIDHLYRAVIRREEHEELEAKVTKLEQDVAEIKGKLHF